VPRSSTGQDWVVIYDAEYKLLPLDKALGHATMALGGDYTLYLPIVLRDYAGG
jgi:hypothetical protein